MSMTYVQIQNAVLENAFDESQRADVKNWIQFRHAWLWDMEEWTFRQGGPSVVTFTANSTVASGVPSDFRHAVALFDSLGAWIEPIRDTREFFTAYNQNLPTTSTRPQAYTVMNGQIILSSPGDGSTGILLYEKSKPALVNDGDTTGLPDGYDVALVHGAKAEGFKLTNIPLWQGFDDDFTAAANALRRNYLTGIRGQVGQMGLYRPAAVQWR